MVIPLPFTKTTFPSQPYSGSDPEWRAFVEFSRDPALQKKIKRRQTRRQHSVSDANLALDELAELAAKTYSRSMKLLQPRGPAAAQVLSGSEGARVRNYLLSFDFPVWPPPEVGTYW